MKVGCAGVAAEVYPGRLRAVARRSGLYHRAWPRSGDDTGLAKTGTRRVIQRWKGTSRTDRQATAGLRGPKSE